jgi:hypothetical protein
MNRRFAVVTAVVSVCAMAATLLAHDFRGSVVSVTPTTITISTVDDTTKKPTQETFDIAKDTKIQRGTKVVSFAEAKIVKGDKVTITIDHELDMHRAIVIKLDEKK